MQINFSSMGKDDIITIMYFSSAQEANLYKSLLLSAGISCSLTGETIHEIFPIGGSMDIELQVANCDELKAREVLAAEFDKNEFNWENKI